MEDKDIEYVNYCIKHNIHLFYNWYKWKRKRKEVLKLDKNECVLCKRKGIYTPATTVHHVNYVKAHPELSLEIWYEWQGSKKRNLISLCHDCHEKVHGYRKRKLLKPLTEERW